MALLVWLGKLSQDAILAHRHRASFFRCDLKAPADSIVGVHLFSQPMNDKKGVASILSKEARPTRCLYSSQADGVSIQPSFCFSETKNLAFEST